MKKLWLNTLLSASLLILSGCGGLTPTPQDKQMVDETLPVVTLTPNGVMADMTSIAFEWHPIIDPRVESIEVYKASSEDGNQTSLEHYDTLKSRFQTHYTDGDVKPDTRYSYAFKVLSKEKQGRMSKIYFVSTKPVLQSVAWIHAVTGLPRSAKIIWRPHKNRRVEKYIIERKTLEEESWDKIDTLTGRLVAEYIDTGLKDNYVYLYRIRVKTYDGIVSTPSEIVKVITKPLPKSVTKIEATKNLPKQIKITWEPTKQKDFYRYYLYRAESLDGDYELIAKLHNPVFIDKVEEDGKNYFYRVSVVDKDGLESEHDKVTALGMSLPKPKAPAVFEAKLIGGAIELRWSKVDPRGVSYEIKRELKKGWFDTQEKMFKSLKGTSFIDKPIEAGATYRYTIYSVDKNGIVSEPSIEVVVVTPESQEPAQTQRSPQQEQRASQPHSAEQQSVAPAQDLELDNL